MFKLPEISAMLVAAVLIVSAVIYGLFQFTVGGLLVVGLALVIGALIGVGLGRNSKTANAAYEKALAEIREIDARTASLRRSVGLD